MSKFLSVENLLHTFPDSVATDKEKYVLATVTAEELMELYESNDLIAIYSRIDELDNELLDILAYCFKIDWWEKSYSVEEKRETFKRCWGIKRKLGTPYASSLAISALFQSAEIREWWQYGGNPYYFKIHIDSGETLADYDKIKKVVNGIRYYKNKRSLLEKIEINNEKNAKVYVGIALQCGTKTQMVVNGVYPDEHLFLVDGYGNILLDAYGEILKD